MPQNNVLPDWRATYPNDAPVQKPGGVTVLTTATAPRVPNKFTYSAGTIQMVSAEMVEGGVPGEETQAEVKEPEEEQVVEEPAEEESAEEDDEDDDGKPRRTTTRTTRTTTRRR
jgi:hypothetical protein